MERFTKMSTAAAEEKGKIHSFTQFSFGYNNKEFSCPSSCSARTKSELIG